MNRKSHSVAIAVSLILGTVGVVNTASAVTLTFQNNALATNPANTMQGFDANSEFHIATPYGTGLNDGHKDTISGGEQWLFNGDTTGSLMAGVANTDLNTGHSGANGQAGLTSGVAGFPIAQTAGTIDTLSQNFDLLGALGDWSTLAPTTGNIIGQTFGAASLDAGTTNNFTQAGTFSIHMPVIYAQWSDGAYILGGDPNQGVAGDKCQANGPCPGPGVVFTGTADGSGNFTLSASHLGSRHDEGTVNGLVFESYFEWSLAGTYAASTVPLPASVWLFGTGMLGLMGVARRRRRRN